MMIKANIIEWLAYFKFHSLINNYKNHADL